MAGNNPQLIFIIHHSSKLQIKIFQKLVILRELSLYAVLETLSPLIIFHQQEIFLKHLQLLDTYSEKEFNKSISIPTVPEEETTKLWQEEHSPIPESLINLFQKSVLKQFTFQLDKQWILVMLLSDIQNKAIQL
jgi:hypothetical protein